MRPALLAITLLLACSAPPLLDSDGGDPVDAGGRAVDSGSPAEAPDASDPLGIPDGGDAPDVGDPLDATDGGTADGGADELPDAGASESDAGSSGPAIDGQCGTSADCATGECNPRPPGGFCLNCGDASDCGVGHARSFTCTGFGPTACNQDCATDTDCPTGLRCHPTQGVCTLRPCGSGCPAPYVCDGSFCARPPCDASCPAGRCSGGYCVVDR